MTPEQTAKNTRVAELAGWAFERRGRLGQTKLWENPAGKGWFINPPNFILGLSAIWQEVQRMTRDNRLRFSIALTSLTFGANKCVPELTPEDWADCYIEVMEQTGGVGA